MTDAQRSGAVDATEAAAGPASTRATSESPILEVRDLHVRFHTADGYVNAVNGVSYGVGSGETLAVVGESGSGKSVTAQTIMGLIDSPPGEITRGQVLYRGQDILRLPKRERRALQGDRIAMVFQDALTALNPSFTIGYQLNEMFRVHRGMSAADSSQRSVELLDHVRIPLARERLKQYPHQLSGGMRQRVMIAIAIALNPDVLIADEPTTALDVTVQAQIMHLLRALQDDNGMSLVLITHDLGVVASAADHVAVMYAGKVVERGTIDEVYRRPAHPYTKAMREAVPALAMKGTKLHAIPGSPPDLAHLPVGCSFAPRCGFRKDICIEEAPPSTSQSPQRVAACHFAEEVMRA